MDQTEKDIAHIEMRLLDLQIKNYLSTIENANIRISELFKPENSDKVKELYGFDPFTIKAIYTGKI